MTTTTDITLISIINALERYVFSALEKNGTPDGWVSLDCLKLTEDQVKVAHTSNIIDIQYNYDFFSFDVDDAVWVEDHQVRFIEKSLDYIYNNLP